MKRVWLFVGTALVLGGSPRLVDAAWLYQPDDQAEATPFQSWFTLHAAIPSLTTREWQSIQPDYPYHALLTPNDPQFSQQWNFQAVEASGAWDADSVEPLYGGDPGVIVAVLDTGVAYENYQSYVLSGELNGTRIWTNPNETADGLDNDGNGLVDDLHGWDFVNSDSHPNDDHGHGTHITGTIAGQTNNGSAVAGLAWQSTILPLKVLDAAGNGTTTTITAAVNYAIQAGADVINLSLGGNTDDAILHQAIQSAINRGIVVIAAAGNDGQSALNYPARYAEVVAVSAVDQNLARTSYSNYGSAVDIAAPGGVVDVDPWRGIVQETCRTTNDCSAMSLVAYTGTSQASAHVAGAAALLVACGAPGGAIPTLLSSTATDLGVAGSDQEYGAGLLNIRAAMSLAGCRSAAPSTPGTITAVSSATTTRDILSNVSAASSSPVFSWSGTSGSIFQVSWGKEGGTTTTSTQTSTSFNPTITSQGIYLLTIRVIDGVDRFSEAQSFRYRFRRPTIVIGTAQPRSAVTLYSTAGQTIRGFSAKLGDVMPLISGTVTERQVARLLVSGVGTGTGVSILDSRGTRLLAWRPFGSGLTGGVQAVGVRQHDAETLIATTASLRGATVRWMTFSGRRVRSVKVFPGHDGGVTLANADLDGDHTDEVIVAKNGGSLLAAYGLDGRRRWQTQPLGKNWRGHWSLTAFDYNNDGRDEVAVAGVTSSGTSTVVIVSTVGRILRTWSLRPSNGAGAVSLASADTNGNGTEELLSLRRTGTGVVDVWSATGRRGQPITLRSTAKQHSLNILD